MPAQIPMRFQLSPYELSSVRGIPFRRQRLLPLCVGRWGSPFCTSVVRKFGNCKGCVTSGGTFICWGHWDLGDVLLRGEFEG